MSNEKDESSPFKWETNHENEHLCSSYLQPQNLLNTAFLDLCSDDEDMEDDSTEDHTQNKKNNHTFSDRNLFPPNLNSNSNSNNSNHRSMDLTPQLIRDERKRLQLIREKQQNIDHFMAMSLQNKLENERGQTQSENDYAIAMNLQRQNEFEHKQSLQNDHEIAMDLQREIEREQNELQQRMVINEMHSHSHSHNHNIVPAYNRSFLNRPELQNNLNISSMDYEDLLEMFPNESHGAKEETIQLLPVDTFKQKKNDNNTSEYDHKCCICLEQFKQGEQIRRLQCLHIFHTNEIDSWLRINRECPICRINVEQHT